MPHTLPNRSLIESLVRESLFREIGKPVLSTPPPTLVVNSSARHMHVSQANLEVLFGPGAKLQPHKMLYQEGQYASTFTVTLVGPRGRTIPNLRILGPCRDLTQIELAYTDAVFMGIEAPVRLSGDIAGSAGGIIIGPKGTIELKQGIIRAARHVHMSPADAKFYGVKHLDKMILEVEAEKCTTRYDDLLVRVDPTFKLEVHIDTDESNACDLCHARRCRLQRSA